MDMWQNLAPKAPHKIVANDILMKYEAFFSLET